MRKFTIGLLGVAALCAASTVTTVTPAAAAQTSFSISFGNIGIAYSDGYYDQNRRWHRWRNNRERDQYRRQHQNSYFSMSHTRDRDRNRNNWRKGKRSNWRPGQGNPHN